MGFLHIESVLTNAASNKSCHCSSVLTCTYRIYTVHIRNLPAPHRWRPTKTCVQTARSGVELVRRKTCIVWRIYCNLTRFLTVTFVPYRTYGEAPWPDIQTCSIYTHRNFKSPHTALVYCIEHVCQFRLVHLQRWAIDHCDDQQWRQQGGEERRVGEEEEEETRMADKTSKNQGQLLPLHLPMHLKIWEKML